MITNIPVARWTWGRDHDELEVIGLCLRELLAAYAVLAVQRLVVGPSGVRVRVHASGHRGLLYDGGFSLFGGADQQETAARLAAEVNARRDAGAIGYVAATVDCTGIIVERERETVQANLFRLGTHTFDDYTSAALTTFSDAWMVYDLKGRAQPDVHAGNQPRLAAALKGFSQVLRSDTDFEDLTHFGIPTETGVDNYFDLDGNPSDVWFVYEV